MSAKVQHERDRATGNAAARGFGAPPGGAGRRQERRRHPSSSSSSPSSHPARGAPWHYVNNSAAADDGRVDLDTLRRRDRLALRAIGRRVSRLKSSPRDGSEPQYTLRKCGVVRCSQSGNVRLRVVDGTGYAEGVVHCGSIWGCAVCAAKIRRGRAEIYSASAARWLADGNTLIMVTLTFPHDMGMRLAPLWDLVSGGAGRLTSSARWRKLRDELGGEVWYRRAIEQTYGESGWHPHCHMLVYVRGDAGAAGLAAIGEHFRGQWAKWVTSQGYRLPSTAHGVRVEACASGAEAGTYIVKTQDGRGVGNELVRADMKSGRDSSLTPFEILREAGNGDKDKLLLWWEFEQASKGRRAITQSQGLAAVLGEDEVTDQELADEDAGGDDVAELDGETWADVIGKGLEAPVFEAAPSGLAAVNEVLRRNGCGLAYAPPLERGS